MSKYKNNILGISAIIFYFLSNLFSNYIIFFTLNLLNIKSISNSNMYLINIIYELFQLVIVLILLHKKIFKDVKQYFSKFKYYVSNYIKYYFIILFIIVISNIILINFVHLDTADNEKIIRILINKYPLISMGFICLIGPLLEEFIFRLSLYNIFKSNKHLFIIISGLIFGVLHLTNITNPLELLYIIPYGAPGCIFAYTMYKSDNIVVPISIHVLNNTISYISQIIR